MSVAATVAAEIAAEGRERATNPEAVGCGRCREDVGADAQRALIEVDGTAVAGSGVPHERRVGDERESDRHIEPAALVVGGVPADGRVDDLVVAAQDRDTAT